MRLAEATIGVTGATGFLGRYIVRSLVQRGARVVGVVRNPDKVPALKRSPSVELRRADLADVNALRMGFSGCDAVINNAALVSVGTQGRGALIEANVTGVRNVFEAMVAAGVERCVHVSSATVYAPRADHFYTEGDALRAGSERANRFTDYPISKALGEREAWRLAERHGTVLSTARPHTVYGAYDRQSFTAWFKRFMAPRWATVFPIGVYLPSVYAGDLGDAFCTMLERPTASGGRAYNLSAAPQDDEGYLAHVRAYQRAGGRVPRWLVPVPVPIRRSYSVRRAVEDLDFTPRTLEEGYRDMLQLERGSL